MKNSNNDEMTSMEKHALNRLDKVEDDHRKEYEKRPDHFSFAKVAMFIITLIIVIIMLITFIN